MVNYRFWHQQLEASIFSRVHFLTYDEKLSLHNSWFNTYCLSFQWKSIYFVLTTKFIFYLLIADTSSNIDSPSLFEMLSIRDSILCNIKIDLLIQFLDSWWNPRVSSSDVSSYLILSYIILYYIILYYLEGRGVVATFLSTNQKPVFRNTGFWLAES